MERKSTTTSLGDAIKEFLRDYKHSSKLLESQVVESWSKIMGPSVASLTQSVYIKNGKLYVTLKSSVLRSELMMQKRIIVETLNEHVGSEVIKDIVLR
jgi:predicted nucleic acid-binding Zn ribbon protein